MLKFLLFTVLFGYLIFKGIGLFFRMLMGSPADNKGSYQRYSEPKKPRGGNVNIDFVPGKNKKEEKDYRGGEYVDYEEVN